MSEAIQTSNDVSQAPSGRVHPLVGRSCCEVWPRFVAIGVFRWMSLEDKTKVMPYIYDADTDAMWRINHCPSCGADVRIVKIPPNATGHTTADNSTTNPPEK